MQPVRELVNVLADDLSWLEEHSRKHPGQALQTAGLRLASALVRNCVGPYLDGAPATPLHVVIVGGAGAGKSTVANLLCGVGGAEANPQAGFTRHPIAYAGGNGVLHWPAHVGFLGSLQRLVESAPADLDADVYQVRRIEDSSTGLLGQFVVWDCPDMTTWAATGYVPRLIEVAGLADVIVYVASDERYNDEAPTQFLRLMLEAGKPVVACLLKMCPTDAPGLVEHFRTEVIGRMPPGVVACLAIPFLTPDELADPVAKASRHRIPLVNQVAVLGEAGARQRTVHGAVTFLRGAQERLVRIVRQDLAALEEWRGVVEAGRTEFERRYRREYLAGEKFRRFDEALVRLLDLLELPGAGRVFSNTLWVARAPYRFLRGIATRALRRPEAPGLPEEPVLEQALSGWLHLLRKEAVRHAGSHPVWRHVENGFVSGLADEAQKRFEQGLRSFRLGLADEVDRTARAIYEELERNPVILNTLRGGKFTFDAAALAAAVATGGLSHWGLDFFLVPLAAAVTHQLVELLGKQYVDSQKEQARNRQQALVATHLSGPLAEWLTQWPATGGTAYERLHLALRRIPANVQRLADAVNQMSASTASAPATGASAPSASAAGATPASAL